MSTNKNLHNAKKAQRDEFYTRYEDIENELVNYQHHFENKVVYCNCDDGNKSNFYRYFKNNFNSLGLRKLISTNYDIGEGAWSYVYDGKNTEAWPLKGNGDFRSAECIEFLKEADIVVTNPPFSLFREYVKQLMDYDKKFLIVGNQNAITYKEIFPYIKNNQLWLGVSPRSMSFLRPNGSIDQVNANWFTNLVHNKRNQPAVVLTKKYDPEYYPKYDNYNAIEVSKVVDIPIDYDGVMGVPITFLDKYNPSQFEIVGLDRYLEGNLYPNKRMFINNKEIYARILIRKKAEFEIVDARDIALNDRQRNKNTYLIKDSDSAINGKPTYARIAIRRKK